MPDLVLATRNPGKCSELRAILERDHSDLKLISLLSLTKAPEVEEDGSSFLENAQIKAKRISQFTQLPTLADDSGLEVDVLGGAPGVHSARYAGGIRNDAANNAKLIRELAGVGSRERTARFRCAMRSRTSARTA